MLSCEQSVSPDLALAGFDVRALARRAALPALAAAGAVAAVLLLGGRVHEFAHALVRGLGVSPGWALAGIVLEGVSLAGYVLLLSLVAGRATSRVGTRESAQITLAGAAATRLLPTAGAGGLALALWALRRAGLRTAAATRTLLTFLVLLYSTFLAAIVVAGTMLTLHLGGGHGPTMLSALPAAVALLAVVFSLALGLRLAGERTGRGESRSRVVRTLRLLAGAVRDACELVRAADLRLAGAVVYWLADAAVLWAMLNTFGSAPAPAVVALAYLVGQVANTVPLPGSVSGGMAGVLVAFGVPLHLALPAVLAYRTIAVWLPAPVAAAAVPRLRATIARWGREDASAPAAA